uniref:Uncharacterized protein n=1 Tax=Timema douglasi TaxID=61478 RepID=A0A7R8Z943_TIMDO|nr:unnamed protein product [Timema douglasi]
MVRSLAQWTKTLSFPARISPQKHQPPPHAKEAVTPPSNKSTPPPPPCDYRGGNKGQPPVVSELVTLSTTLSTCLARCVIAVCVSVCLSSAQVQRQLNHVVTSTSFPFVLKVTDNVYHDTSCPRDHQTRSLPRAWVGQALRPLTSPSCSNIVQIKPRESTIVCAVVCHGGQDDKNMVAELGHSYRNLLVLFSDSSNDVGDASKVGSAQINPAHQDIFRSRRPSPPLNGDRLAFGALRTERKHG